MSDTEEVSVIPVVAAAVQVSEAQETRDAANEAETKAETAQAEAEVAGDTAQAAGEAAGIAAEVAVASAEIGVEAAISAEEAKQESGQALSEIGQLREDVFGRLDEIRNLLSPPIEDEPAVESGVKEVVLDGSDIGESGLESGSGSATTVHGDNAGSESSGNNTSRSRGFKRGRR